ncbi:hypothetical protein E2P81_ATG06267 [Venturia nashicola]|nr:hypothetical protein E2P81_ATG06267 [Venturia nashicola]
MNATDPASWDCSLCEFAASHCSKEGTARRNFTGRIVSSASTTLVTRSSLAAHGPNRAHQLRRRTSILCLHHPLPTAKAAAWPIPNIHTVGYFQQEFWSPVVKMKGNPIFVISLKIVEHTETISESSQYYSGSRLTRRLHAACVGLCELEAESGHDIHPSDMGL